MFLMSAQTFTVRPAQAADAPAWLRMRNQLWPESAVDHQNEVAAYFAGRSNMPAEVLIACTPEGEAVGFAELSIRSYAEGCVTDRVLYLEGWFVEPAWRKRGVGQQLVQAAEDWGRAQGCTEFGSDAEIGNVASHLAHRALGFVEVERIVSFKKKL